jgi:hypothetical protein
MALKPYCAVGLRLDEHHFFGQAVRCVGLFGITVPQISFFKRYRRELRIGANRSDCDEFFDLEAPRVLHHLDAHNRIVIKETAGIGAVGANAANHRGQVDHDFRSGLLVETNDCLLGAKIIIGRTRTMMF